jgi:RNA polymerase sigma-B factor
MGDLEIAAAVRAHVGEGDDGARMRLIESYLPLVRHIAARHVGRGERVEDLVQVGAVGLIGAIDRCREDAAATLTAYAARCIEGEIRRHLRDRCAVVRVPRNAPTTDAAALATARAPIPLEDELADALTAGDELDDVGISRALVASAAQSLDGRERRVVALRYFLDLTQAEVGETVGLSQVHVSRVLSGAIEKMRAGLEAA